MDPAADSPAWPWPVEELASRAGLPVRTIREYQTMRVLQSPQRRGRLGFYGEAHLSRLRLIARLQDRGYSLAGIRDLLEAWAAGQDLAGVIEDPDAPLLDEAPVVMDGAQLAAALPHVPPVRLGELTGLGLVSDCGPDRFCVPSPSLLRLLADATASGVSTDGAFAFLAAITMGVHGIARAAAGALRAALDGRAGEEATVQLMQRGRGLIAQGTGRLLLHELALALSGSQEPPGDPGMAAAVDRVRVSQSTALDTGTPRPGLG